MTPGIQFEESTKQDYEDFEKLNINYWTYIGILNYLSCRTRPDLASTVSILSKYCHAPSIKHWNQVLHCWKYLKGTSDLAFRLQPSQEAESSCLEVFTDATWADDRVTRLFQSGSIFFWKNCPISWNSHKQHNIAMSSTEAELNSLSDEIQENL